MFLSPENMAGITAILVAFVLVWYIGGFDKEEKIKRYRCK
jgi:hypothetical protein